MKIKVNDTPEEPSDETPDERDDRLRRTNRKLLAELRNAATDTTVDAANSAASTIDSTTNT